MDKAIPSKPAAIAARTIFVTGTDTGVGKSTVACALLRAARAQGLRACGYKPVASGSEDTPEGLRNADALALQTAAATAEPYERINPYVFGPPTAPHLAAAAAGTVIRTDVLDRAHAELALRYDCVIVEGAGGWQVPLDAATTMADWVSARGWPVLMVVGMRLGCINHALLTAESIARRTRLLGWIGNALPPRQQQLEENIDDLRQRLSAPLMGLVPPTISPDSIDLTDCFRRVFDQI